MKTCGYLFVLLACSAALFPANVSAQESEGGNEGSEGTDVGANPPNALIGCNSPYTYLEANSRGGLDTFHSLVEADPDVKAAMKYRNFTGTLLMPTDAAFAQLAQTRGLSVLQPGALTTALLQTILEYHVLFDTIDPTTLAAQQGQKSFETTLSLGTDGQNNKLNAAAWELFAQNSALTYESLIIDVAATTVAPAAQAPLGTYTVTGGASSANIIWSGNTEPTRTCLGYIYLIDGVLLPSNDTLALGVGGAATTPIAEAGESEGASVEGPATAVAG